MKRVFLLIVIIGVLLALPARQHLTYLPIIKKPPTCAVHAKETRIADRIIDHPDQKRTQMNCNTILAHVARQHAVDMAENNYVGHRNSEGKYPNERIIDAGYQLPYPPKGNNVESIAFGYETSALVMEAWLSSPSHRDHILGTRRTYREQLNYGIGYHFDSDSIYKHYWVFISAP